MYGTQMRTHTITIYKKTEKITGIKTRVSFIKNNHQKDYQTY